jgi:hypothetical protein
MSFMIGLSWMALGFLCLLGITKAFRVKLPALQMAE